MPKFNLNWSPNTGDQPIYETLGIAADRIKLFEKTIDSHLDDPDMKEIGQEIKALSELAETEEELAYANYLLGAKIADINVRNSIVDQLRANGFGVQVLTKEELDTLKLAQIHKKDDIVN